MWLRKCLRRVIAFKAHFQEKEAWRMTFERAKPNAMRLRIEVFPKNSSTASQLIYAFPDPKGV